MDTSRKIDKLLVHEKKNAVSLITMETQIKIAKK